MSEPTILGKGSFGCVYVGSTLDNNKHNKLIKLMIDSNDFLEEVKNTELINIIDKELTSLKIEDIIVTNIAEELKNNHKSFKSISKCDFEGNDKIYQIVYDINNKGEDLKIIKNNKSFPMSKFITIISKFKNLYESIYAYSKFDLINNDIKCNNIVYIDKIQKLSFIDFGLIQNINNFEDLNGYNILMKNLYVSYYHVEYRLIYYILNNIDVSVFINDYINDKNFMKIINFNNIYKIENIKEDLKNLYEYYKKLYILKKDINQIFTYDDINKFDLYSLSFTFYEFIIDCYHNNRENYKNNPRLIEKLSKIINNIILPSICLDTRKRISIKETLNRFI